MSLRWLAMVLILPMLFWAQFACAAVTLTLYSHELGSNFPHALIVLKGTVDATGDTVDVNYGFTAVNVSPGILFGAVKGKVATESSNFVKNSTRHFSIVLTDKQYGIVLAEVDKWRNKKQKSYNLNKANCVHFVAAVLESLGYKTNQKSEFFKKPTSFLKEVAALNPSLQK